MFQDKEVAPGSRCTVKCQFVSCIKARECPLKEKRDRKKRKCKRMSWRHGYSIMKMDIIYYSIDQI